jgi:hypothetical protein
MNVNRRGDIMSVTLKKFFWIFDRFRGGRRVGFNFDGYISSDGACDVSGALVTTNCSTSYSWSRENRCAQFQADKRSVIAAAIAIRSTFAGWPPGVRRPIKLAFLMRDRLAPSESVETDE